MISVICPFYNEAAILEASVRQMLGNLASLDRPWELIIVNDGSTDGSWEMAHALADGHPKLRVVGYPRNRGRGFALRTGIAAANGDIVVTTEIDSSWGADIVHRIIEVFDAQPDTEMVIASPNLPGGGYRNVPKRRVLISRVGNYILRAALTPRITMYTGMTRGYRKAKFLELPIDEDEKEFHLEVARKALAFNFGISEVPAILTWQHEKLSKPGATQRRSSSRMRHLMRTHLWFGMFAAPVRYILVLVAAFALPATVFLLLSVRNLLSGEPAAFYLLSSLSLYMFALLMFVMGVLTQQNMSVQQELWRIRGDMERLRQPPGERSPPADRQGEPVMHARPPAGADS